MKFFPKTTAILAMALAPLATMAADPLKDVAGYASGGGYSPVFVPSAVAADNSYTVTMEKSFGVAFNEQVGGAKAIRGPFTDKPTKKKVWHFAIMDGATIYAMPLGDAWGDMSEVLEEVDIAKASAQGVVANGKVTFKFIKGERPCPMVNCVVVNADGTRFWGAHPEPSAWIVRNNLTSPRTGWCAKGSEIVSVDQYDSRIRQLLAKKK